jgi:hypothetical protein
MNEHMHVCEWFPKCTNPATAERAHPLLGSVPICGRCAAQTDRIEAGR